MILFRLPVFLHAREILRLPGLVAGTELSMKSAVLEKMESSIKLLERNPHPKNKAKGTGFNYDSMWSHEYEPRRLNVADNM